MQVQQEEPRHANEELEEKTRSLIEKGRRLEDKNRELEREAWMPGKILLIDDPEAVLKATRWVLERAGRLVLTSPTARDRPGVPDQPSSTVLHASHRPCRMEAAVTALADDRSLIPKNPGTPGHRAPHGS